ncbi:hypothetical protein SDC9_183706 [bioreactor metagenome]|uniref:Uncharacterized protein n=1 Tax=bioreactor metagenome TaxID=1076179 RepID=A0A645HAZ1_9ZZZZ
MFSTLSVLFVALITPAVTVLESSSPIGLPTTIANCPTVTAEESPSVAAVSPVLLIFRRAKSVTESTPTTVASTSSPVDNVTTIESLPEMTW